MNCEDNYFPKGKINLLKGLFHSVYLVLPKKLFSIADLFAVQLTVRGLYVTKIINADCCDMARGWFKLFCLASLHSHVLCAYCKFESRQANSITLFWQCLIKNYNVHLIMPIDTC